MDDKRLMKTLGEAARERRQREKEALDPRWDQLAAGELSQDGMDELRSQAEDSPWGREVARAFEPLDEDVQERIVRKAEEALVERRAPRPGTGEADKPSDFPRLPLISRLDAGRRRWWLLPSLGAAAAAALWLLLLTGPLSTSSLLPINKIKINDGSKTERSSDERPHGIPRFTPGDLLTAELGAESRLQNLRSIKLQALRFDGVRLKPILSIKPKHIEKTRGALRLSCYVNQPQDPLGLELDSGLWTLVLVAGFKSDLPSEADLLAALHESSPGEIFRGQGWVGGAQQIEILVDPE